jgi:PEGA domain-containing protein
MRIVLLILVLLGPIGLGGCASVTRGWNEQIQITSEPEGADVRTSLSQACTTPCTLTVSRKDEFSVSYSKPGYQPQTVQVNTRVAGAGVAGFAGNVLVGGIIGMGVDAASGATLEHHPNPVVAVLQPVAPARQQPQPPGRQRKNDGPKVSHRAPAPPVVATPVSAVVTEPEPVLSESDRTMFMRN